MIPQAPTPRALGYRFPAEWEPHAATWLSWPRRDGGSFPDRYDEVLPAFGEIVRALAPHEPVHINVSDADAETAARAIIGVVANVTFHQIPTNEPWCRDHGPIFVTRDRELAVVNWNFNGWGEKYRHNHDDIVAGRVAELLGLPQFQPGIILEGGSIDGNGAGTLLTTESCLLNRNRNPHLSRGAIEQHLREFLGVTDILWLAAGLAGDDTDGHVDDLARFVDATTVVTIVEDDPRDENYEALRDNLDRLRTFQQLRRIVELPMPGVVAHRGQRLPASYANFYIAASVVLLPTYRHPNDKLARAILQELFPTRRIIPINCTALIWGRGAIHCLTQQQPAV